MVVSMLVRLGLSLTKALKFFKDHRPNGIYKDDYIKTLYQYYHELL